MAQEQTRKCESSRFFTINLPVPNPFSIAAPSQNTRKSKGVRGNSFQVHVVTVNASAALNGAQGPLNMSIKLSPILIGLSFSFETYLFYFSAIADRDRGVGSIENRREKCVQTSADT